MDPTTADLIADLFRATQALADRFPDRPWTPDGHPVGSIGEVLAAERYGLTLQPPSTTGHDAIDAQGRRVEVKATTGNKGVDLRDCHADRLIVLQITEEGEPVEVYDGPAAPAWAAVAHRKPGSNGQKLISLAQLRRLQAEQHPHPCPACGGRQVPLIFGMPTRETFERAERGEVALGGCCLPESPGPTWRCLACGGES